MDYKARFYSPHLSRFIQPDTLIPGAGDPQAWNRYSYVLNSPVKYNDPSGHVPIIDDDEYGNPVLDKGWKKRARLTKYPDDCNAIGYQGYCYAGNQMKDLYGWYTTHPGQWNNYDVNNGFTIQEFLAWILNAEIGYTLKDPNILGHAKTLTAEKMMWLCGRFAKSGSCSEINENAILNYIATRASAAFRYETFSQGGNPDVSYTIYDPKSLEASLEVASYGVSYRGKPSIADWGNGSLFSPTTLKMLTQSPPGSGRSQYLAIYPSIDAASSLYFFSAAQSYYWHCINGGGISC